MLTLHTLTFYLHILVGSMALLLVWVPLTVEKGRLNHRRFGRYYNNAMYLVSLSGAVMALLVLIDPMMIHGHRLSNPANEQLFVERMRVFYSLLLYLSLLVYCGLRHGEITLKSKQNKKLLRAKSHILSNALLAATSPVLFYLGWQESMTLPMVFAVLGLVTGLSNIKYCLSDETIGNTWLREHISAQLGTAIGAYTAFLAFGGRTIFENAGEWRLIFWIAPGVVGAIAIRKLCQKYAPVQGTKIASRV
ncbi:hypothetical protein [Planctobacterium marinum]|uniref:Membrane protein n=1 Tax=Planctobacterium marinum TaxID=1631968 RepID=A0AA48KRV1_9ALTE|nr:membrane protein [Planctobacterium marinum]